MPYVKVTGYLEVSEDDVDMLTGLLTAEGYDRQMTYSPPGPATIAALEDVEVEPDDRT